MAYKGKYKLRKPEKYAGKKDEVVFRSLWERQVFRWLEDQDDVIEWVSEEVVIPYVCATDKKVHRYFIDIYYKTKDGRKYLIEIKPKKETVPPKTPTKKTKRYINEAMTYIKNQSKWKAAVEFAKDNGCEFHVWTEDTLKGLGIKLLTK